MVISKKHKEVGKSWGVETVVALDSWTKIRSCFCCRLAERTHVLTSWSKLTSTDVALHLATLRRSRLRKQSASDECGRSVPVAFARPTHDLFARTSVVEKSHVNDYRKERVTIERDLNFSKNMQNMRRKKKDWLFDRLAYLLKKRSFSLSVFLYPLRTFGETTRDSSADCFLRENIE